MFGTPDFIIKSSFQAPFKERTNYSITSIYGERNDPFTGEKSFHNGIDLAADEDTNIVSVYDGYVIEKSFQENGLGEYVVVEHNIEGEILMTTYGHLLENSIIVEVGEKVSKNQIIATIGSTGKSTGVHVHFMISYYKYGKEKIVNPNFMFAK